MPQKATSTQRLRSRVLPIRHNSPGARSRLRRDTYSVWPPHGALDLQGLFLRARNQWLKFLLGNSTTRRPRWLPNKIKKLQIENKLSQLTYEHQQTPVDRQFGRRS